MFFLSLLLILLETRPATARFAGCAGIPGYLGRRQTHSEPARAGCDQLLPAMFDNEQTYGKIDGLCIHGAGIN